MTVVKRNLEYVAVALGVLVAYIHLLHPQYGFPRLLEHVRLGMFFDPRPLVFTIAGLLILAGFILAYNGVARKPLLIGGIIVVGGLFVGYGLWHTVLDHGAFWPYIEPHGHTDTGPFQIIVLHLFQNPIELISKIAEAILLIVLILLYRLE